MMIMSGHDFDVGQRPGRATPPALSPDRTMELGQAIGHDGARLDPAGETRWPSTLFR